MWMKVGEFKCEWKLESLNVNENNEKDIYKQLKTIL